MYELTSLFWYRPFFMAELIIAETLFLARLQRRTNFYKRLPVALLICFGVAFAFPVASYNAYYCSFMFLCLFGVTVAAACFLFEESITTVLFCALAGYTTQHIAYELNNLIVILSGINDGAPPDLYGSSVGQFGQPETGDIRISSAAYLILLFYPFFLQYLIYFLSYIFIYFSAWQLFAGQITQQDILKLKNISVIFLLVAVVLIDVVFSSIVTYSVTDYASVEIRLLYVYNILCGALALYIQFELPKRKRFEKELDIVTQLRAQEAEQYKISQESIELINLKCHDLRHQIRHIGDKMSVNEKAVAEIENVISIYDSTVKTENKTLDVILTEKSLLCKSKNISLRCVVDGESLNFISEPDLYSLFGNLIDNAMEAVEKLDDDKKIIGLIVKKVNMFLSINVHNFYGGEIKFENGFPVTTKDNGSFYHGYGMKSINSICQKYGGEMAITTENNVFNVGIVFPAE